MRINHHESFLNQAKRPAAEKLDKNAAQSANIEIFDYEISCGAKISFVTPDNRLWDAY